MQLTTRKSYPPFVRPVAALAALSIVLVVTLAAAKGTRSESGSISANSKGVALAETSPRPLSAKDRSDVFEQVWKTVAEKYYDASFNGVDWNEVHQRYRARVDGAASDDDFYGLLGRMLAELDDAHTVFRSPEAIQGRSRRVNSSGGIVVREIDGKTVIVSVTPNSEAASAGLKPGMIVLTIDGQPVAERIARVKQRISATFSERLTNLFAYESLLSGDVDTTLTLRVSTADGSVLDAKVIRRAVPSAPPLTARLLESGYGYLKFDHFRSPVDNQVKDALEKFKTVPGLILDLRRNGGGDTSETLRIAGFLLNDRVFFGRGITRTGKPLSLLGGLIKVPLEAYAGRRGGQIYGGPIAILISARTGSAAEIFAAAFQEYGRATIIGAQSCGCVAIVNEEFDVKGGGRFTVSQLGYVTPKGQVSERIGVKPDRPVSLTMTDVRSGRDEAITEAEHYFASLSKK